MVVFLSAVLGKAINGIHNCVKIHRGTIHNSEEIRLVLDSKTRDDDGGEWARVMIYFD